MLSRVADSLYWMCRYIERAENVARFIDVNFHLILDNSRRQDEQWQPLVNITGDYEAFAERYESPSRENVIAFLTFDAANANSIISCVRSARENARTIRDVITSEMWEQLNSFYLLLNDASAPLRAAESPFDFFSHVKLASQTFLGITDMTLTHGEAWNFCRMGRLLERTDKTTRILDVKYFLLQRDFKDSPGGEDSIQWSAVLKSASALEMYRKKHRAFTPGHVVEFLLLEREFPRAALFCLNSADEALHLITSTPRGSFKCPPEKLLGHLCAELSYANVDDILIGGLHGYLDVLQSKLNGIGESIHDTFFTLRTSIPGTAIFTKPKAGNVQVQFQG